MKKIRRNEPCPCGSGRKYKHCCMNSNTMNACFQKHNNNLLQHSSLDAPKLKVYMENHDCTRILDYLIALQLRPENHGKNLRIEHITQLAVSCLGKSRKAPDISVFKALIDEEYPMDIMEDLPTNMFAELVTFYGGNYVFFPGITTNAVELFRVMTEAIFHYGTFENDFRRHVYEGVVILLKIGDLLARRAGIAHTTRGNGNPRENLVEPNNAHSYILDGQTLNDILGNNGLDNRVLDPFILDINDPMLLTENADDNPILYKPIVHYDNNYFFVGISNQGCAINNFIIKTAAKYNCLSTLISTTQTLIWVRIGSSCIDHMHWQMSSLCDLTNMDEHYNDALFQIDVNWLAYVCFPKDTVDDVLKTSNNGGGILNIDDHLETSLSAIRKDARTKDFHILTLVLYSSMGETYTLLVSKQPNSDYQLLFSAFDFLQLIQTEKWDNLSLVRFARTKEVNKSLNVSFNQTLDIYSLYKHYGESFYISDDAVPTRLYIEPNDGYRLIFDSKEKLNIHSIPLTINGRVAYIPVQRDMDYADIYKPIEGTIKARCCNSYAIPVWIKCLQKEKEGQNPSSIIDTIITAIAYWMDILRSPLEQYIQSLHMKLIEIDVVFSEEILSDKDLHNELTPPKTAGNLNIVKTRTGLSVAMDYDYILSFMGPYNESERVMMENIVQELFYLDHDTSHAIIDNGIPFGLAKMILMTEVSQNSLTSPLWLYPPIYVHKATSQLLLDQFPKWMQDNGVKIQELKTKSDKESFLHKGVDVLLERLAKRISVFDAKLLLGMLLNNHETLIYRREHNKVLQPAQILCFGDSQDKREEFYDEELLLTNAGLATRALIEYVAATQNQTGVLQPGSDDIESLLAIMNEVVTLGGICDAIHLGMAEYSIKMLESGRFGIYDDDFNNNIEDFASARSIESVNTHMDNFNTTMEKLAIHNQESTTEKDDEYDKIDKAFETDWGISYSNILRFFYSCHLIAINEQTSVVEISESELVKELVRLCKQLTPDVVKKCLDRFSLSRRADYLTPSHGFESRDIYPWVYNRELSFLRRPIIRWSRPDNQTQYMFGFRSCIVGGLQLTDLLYSGRLRNTGRCLDKIKGFFESKKGREFNDVVRQFLQTIPELKVWKHDVTIKENGHISAEMDYGDIDVLAYDSSRNILYSIECKNTNVAKNIKEMKTEMDEYLGRGNDLDKDCRKALVLKHLRRHKWIIDNIDKVKSYIGIDIDKDPTIKSMMLTSGVIPTSYLKMEDSPLSILNFPMLKIKGLAYLDTCKEPNISILS